MNILIDRNEYCMKFGYCVKVILLNKIVLEIILSVKYKKKF